MLEHSLQLTLDEIFWYIRVFNQVCHWCNCIFQLSWGKAFPTILHAHLEKTDQISLCIRTVRSESSHSTLWVAKDQKSPQMDSEDSDQPMRMHRLI